MKKRIFAISLALLIVGACIISFFCQQELHGEYRGEFIPLTKRVLSPNQDKLTLEYEGNIACEININFGGISIRRQEEIVLNGPKLTAPPAGLTAREYVYGFIPVVDLWSYKVPFINQRFFRLKYKHGVFMMYDPAEIQKYNFASSPSQ